MTEIATGGTSLTGDMLTAELAVRAKQMRCQAADLLESAVQVAGELRPGDVSPPAPTLLDLRRNQLSLSRLALGPGGLTSRCHRSTRISV